jgi:hypothetical protein
VFASVNGTRLDAANVRRGSRNALFTSLVLLNVEMRKGMQSTDRPVLITDAAASAEDQLSARKRRYVLLMGGRLALFLLAALFYPVSAWLAVGLLAMSLPLPWMAVLIANDAPARRTEDIHRLTGPAPVRQLETRSHMIVDIPENR